MLCLFAAALGVEIVRLTRRIPALHGARANRAVFAAVALLMIAPFTIETVHWIAQLRHPDTRTVAAHWLMQTAPSGSRVGVENGGPTYLGDAGFHVVRTEALIDHPVAWYHGRADYLIVSGTDVARYADYLNAGPLVFQIAPTLQRSGPPIRIVKLR
jgi:hypothetical protein